MRRQFTGTAYIIEGDRILLIKHRKLQKWLPPGGHLDPNELPHEGAIREAFEETGLRVEVIPDDPVEIDHWNACSFPRSFMCLLEEIPAFGEEPAHQHMDMIYIARPVGGEVTENPRETDGIRWFTLEEVEGLTPDQDVFAETQKTIRTIFEKQGIASAV